MDPQCTRTPGVGGRLPAKFMAGFHKWTAIKYVAQPASSAVIRGLYLLYSTEIHPLFCMISILENLIQILQTQSIQTSLPMSFFADSLALRRKHTATERAENNGDPLVIKKKACEAAKSNAEPTPAVTKAVPVPKNSSNVSPYYFCH